MKLYSPLGEEEYNANLAQILKGESRHAKIAQEVLDVQKIVDDFIHLEKGDPRQGLNLIYNNTQTDSYSEENGEEKERGVVFFFAAFKSTNLTSNFTLSLLLSSSLFFSLLLLLLSF